ncbi:MAG TPA: DUF4426 domain-containing protein [Steroidobacteraceae bacterium]|nr:DUF4426 domain-containing protein [Steroidobacteraceae bacterium]
MKTQWPWAHALCILIATTLGACGGADNDTVQRAQTAAPTEETFRDFGDYEVHFNAVRTDQLTPDVARAYGIQRSQNRVLLNVAMLRKVADAAPREPVSGDVSVDAYNLSGQLKNLEMREVTEGEAIYHIGEVTISGTEILVFDIDVTPLDRPGAYSVQFKREFVAE